MVRAQSVETLPRRRGRDVLERHGRVAATELGERPGHEVSERGAAGGDTQGATGAVAEPVQLASAGVQCPEGVGGGDQSVLLIG